jgi:hypothetical protein
MVRNELSPQSNFSNHCIFTKTRPVAGFSQCELFSFSSPVRLGEATENHFTFLPPAAGDLN